MELSHDLASIMGEVRIERFWSYIATTDNLDDCWLWTRCKNKDGYGEFVIGSKIPCKRAHRIAWELTYGPIPKGMCICHSCDVRSCCNVRHLWLGTQMENIADRHGKNRSAKKAGEINPKAKVTLSIVELMRKEYKPGVVTLEFLAKKYGITNSQVSKIVRGDAWNASGEYKQVDYGLKNKSGENSPVAKLTTELVKKMRTLRKTARLSYKDLALMFDISVDHVGRIIRNEVWIE